MNALGGGDLVLGSAILLRLGQITNRGAAAVAKPQACDPLDIGRRDGGDLGQPTIGRSRIALDNHGLGERVGTAIDGLAFAKRRSQQFGLRLRQLGG